MIKLNKAFSLLAIGLMIVAFGAMVSLSACGKPEQPSQQKAEVKKDEAPAKAAEKKAPKATDEERFKIELGNSYWKGEKNAPVTIVEFSEFQCPFCSRVTPTVAKVLETYPGKIKVVFKHNPLSFHKNAMPASMAALAAGEQGKFWEMHDKLFANQRELTEDNFIKWAGELGLNVDKFKAGLNNEAFKKQIEADQKQAANFAARGTPHLFINGIRLRGAQPFEKFKEVIDVELANAEKFKGSADIYAEVIKNAKTKADAPKPQQRQEDTAVYKIDTGANSPVKGGKDTALITIVEFSEFQCPFCSRVVPTLNKIMDEYGKDNVRVFFRSNPLPFHKDAMGACKAALAAGKQGKYWEMHDVLFKNQKALKQENLEQYAKDLGLNMAKFKKDQESPEIAAQIKSDMDEAAKFGARGTPAFFINGRKFTGAQPFENFKKLIDELLPVAKKVGKKGDALYAELTKNGKEKAAAPQRKPQEDPNKVFPQKPGNSYFKGPKNAPITIIEFSDYQCPFCKRVEPTINQLMTDYKGKIKVYFKHSPLPFHKDAPLASEAALAAGEQGKFWEMHDKLYENNRALKREDLEKYAKEVGLDMNKFKKALDSGAYKSAIDEDMKYAKEVGARGTPTFLINGKKLVGAQPVENFKKIIDAELAAKK